MPDLKFALRRLASSPGYTLVVLVTLALGMGLNTAMFGLANVLLLRPLPFASPESLVRLHRAIPGAGKGAFSPADYLDLQAAGGEIGRFAAYAKGTVALSEPGQPAESHEDMRVSPQFFEVLGVTPDIGRLFGTDDGVFGNHRVLVLGHALWRTRFGGDRGVLGRQVRLDGEMHEVVGVLPAWVNQSLLIRQAGVFRPLAFDEEARRARGKAWVQVLGRRAPGVGLGETQAFVAGVGARLASAFPQENGEAVWQTVSLDSSLVSRQGRTVIALLVGLSGGVLLIACANLANLLLARALSRTHEMALRAALGASRLLVVRPLAWESLLLAIGGGAGALYVATAAGAWLSARSVADGGAPFPFVLDWRMLAFATGVSFLTAGVFGVGPALLAARAGGPMGVSRARGAGRPAHRLRSVLVAAQFTAATALVAVTGFFALGARALLDRPRGWDAASVVVGSIDLPAARYPGPEDVIAFQRRAAARLGAVPGVAAASFSHTAPCLGGVGTRRYAAEGAEGAPAGESLAARFNGVSPAYFDVTGVRRLAGRAFLETDTAAASAVVIVNESLARALFPAGDALGRRVLRIDGERSVAAEIVGVVADAEDVGVYDRPVPHQVYHPLAQEPRHSTTLAVRAASGPAEGLIAPLSAAFAAVDPYLPLRHFGTAEARMARSTADLDMLMTLLGAFSLLGVLLAALGIYGVSARAVADRTAEIGVRVALGARTLDVMGLVLGSGLRLAVIGAGAGLAIAFALSFVVGQLMPSLPGRAGAALSGALLLTGAAALVSCLVPARRAARIQPAVALRAE